MKINNYLNNVIKNLDGSLIGIGIEEEKTINLIDKNKKITICNLLDCFNPDSYESGKLKKIRVRKLRKKFKKNRTNYMICNIEKIDKFKEKFVYDSIYICNKDMYLYDKNNINLENIIRRYSRFCKLEQIKCNDGTVLKINQIRKMNKFNEFFNNLKDTIINFIDLISNLLSD